jgi:hypothetical protein
VYTISGSEARPLPEWLVRRRKRYATNQDILHALLTLF